MCLILHQIQGRPSYLVAIPPKTCLLRSHESQKSEKTSGHCAKRSQASGRYAIYVFQHHRPGIVGLGTSLKVLTNQLGTTVLLPWPKEFTQDENIKRCLTDQVHAVAVPTFTVIVDLSLEFTVYVYNWPIPDDHKIYSDHKQSIKIAQDIRQF